MVLAGACVADAERNLFLWVLRGAASEGKEEQCQS